VPARGWIPGAEVAGCRLLERIGAGGQGAVWRAEHVASGALRAVKATPTDDPELVLRFQREAATLAELTHPNLVRVHSTGTAFGCAYLVMDLAPGGDLAERLEAGPLAPREARRLATTLAHTLAHVHARGLLHRDLKPSNVLFAADGRPLLADFGLARVEGSSLTQTGTVLGTPAYMAPEQISDAGGVDARADVYGLGAVLFHALTGRAPFVAETTLATLTQVLRAPPPDPRTLAPRVPADLAEVCRQALAKDPGERPPSAEAFAAALERRSSLRWTGLAAAGALALLGLGGVALALALRSPATAPAGGAPPAEPAVEEPSVETSSVAVDPPSEPTAADPPSEPTAAPHPLDRVLGALPAPTAEDFADCEATLVHRFLPDLLAQKAGLGLDHAQEWLWRQNQRRLCLALLYRCARDGTDLSSKRAWGILGRRLMDGAHVNAGWTGEIEWARDGLAVIRECFRRGREAGCANAMLREADLLRDGAPAFGLEPDLPEAVRLYRQVDQAKHCEHHVFQRFQVRLAQFALDHPDVEGAPSYREAQERLEAHVLGDGPLDSEHARGAKLHALLRQRIEEERE